MRRISKRIRPYAEKARDSALLAIEVYNKPAVAFRSSGYITLMIIAWTALLHAVFFRRKIKPYYKTQNGRFEIVDGDYKHWELKKCIGEYWGSDTQNPVRKNIEFFIPLRNKIEHRQLPQLDAEIFGECQALLLNFDTVIGRELGPKFQLRESLSFALQLFPSRSSLAEVAKKSKHARDLKEFIDKYRSLVTTEASDDGIFAFKAFLIQVSNHKSQEAIAVQFLNYDKLTPEQQEAVGKIPGLIKTKNVPVVNIGLLKVKQVITAVQKGLGNPTVKRGAKTIDKFNQITHRLCWARYDVRPKNGAPSPEKTDQRYCVYDKVHKDYLYTEGWVAFLIDKMADESEYNSLYKEKAG